QDRIARARFQAQSRACKRAGLISHPRRQRRSFSVMNVRPANMTELHKIETGPGLVFDVLVAGPVGAPLVLLLHGFAESSHMWRSQLSALAAAGYRAVA